MAPSRPLISDSDAAEALWLPEGARLEPDASRPSAVKAGRSIYVDGTGAVVFSIAAECDDVATALSSHFEQQAWQPRQTQDINPHLRTSFETGCQANTGGVRPTDAAGRPIAHGPYMDWHGEWENQAGDLVIYDVGGVDGQLRGVGTFVTRTVREARRRAMRR